MSVLFAAPGCGTMSSLPVLTPARTPSALSPLPPGEGVSRGDRGSRRDRGEGKVRDYTSRLSRDFPQLFRASWLPMALHLGRGALYNETGEGCEPT
jgi:hypothetical protein